jgi:hypothetical protein
MGESYLHSYQSDVMFMKDVLIREEGAKHFEKLRDILLMTSVHPFGFTPHTVIVFFGPQHLQSETHVLQAWHKVHFENRK